MDLGREMLTSICDTDGIHELVEESSSTTEPLENSNPFRSNVEREELDQVR